jgi:hypothetical protein
LKNQAKALIYSLVLSGMLLIRPGMGAEVNRNAINTLYFGGELAAVAAQLLPLLESGQSFSKSDSIFIYKNLSVVMAADPATRAKAQAYMYKLFVLAPSVDIIDMFVSDTIYMMFQNVKNEYLSRTKYNQAKQSIETTGRLEEPLPAKSKEPKPADSKSHWVAWTIGGVAIVGGVAAYLILSQTEQQPKRTTLTN